jgi:hypothetical protein
MACSDFSAKRQNKRQPSIDVASNALPKSPVSSSQNEVVPHINIRSPRLRPGKFVVGEIKRLLQHYLPEADHEGTTTSGGIAENLPQTREREEIAIKPFVHAPHARVSGVTARVAGEQGPPSSC